MNKIWDRKSVEVGPCRTDKSQTLKLKKNNVHIWKAYDFRFEQLRIMIMISFLLTLFE